MRVFTSVSVINETFDNAGISYLTSKLMTHSTTNRSGDILIKDMENIGSELSNETNFDISGIDITCLSRYFDRALELLSDVVSHPLFDEKELLFEKQNVIAALNLRKDNISTIVHDEFIKLFYNNTSYSLPILGTKKTVLKIARKDLLKWHKYSYNASNILISVVGSINVKLLKQSLEKYFSCIQNGIKPERAVFNIQHSKTIKKKIKCKFSQAYIYTGFPAPSLDSKDFVPIKVARYVLGGRMMSRLFVELREKLGLAYELSAVYPERRGESYFAVYMGLDKRNVDLALKSINKILKDFCAIKVSDQELKDVKAYMKGIYVMDRQTVSKKSAYYGWLELVGRGCEYEKEYLKNLDKITANDLINVANKIFSRKSVSVIMSPDV
ncbi:MAG: insulinase family protein [Endomicrobium sp.]|jgi:predicted Zn-dependent peptidase|nr:insulinase family protein [Endomicrobium sp.]